MSRTVTALYDTTAEAEAARQRLSAAVDVERVRVIDQGSSHALNDYPIASEDRHAYGEGLRRGGALLCAKVDGHEDADRIVRALEETGSVDLDDRQQSWRNEGWMPFTTDTAGTGTTAGTTAGVATTGLGNSVEEQRIPIVEEELRVGKREVERGGARVRSYVREVPVHEQVTLREEHVHVERRPVDRPLGAGESAGDLLRDRSVEMVEHAEEAVVQKVAAVREEVVVSKTAEQHVETITDTVSHTEVDVEQGARSGGPGDRSAFGGFDRGSDGSR